MYKIKILSIGKTKEAWLQLAIDEYLKRLQPVAAFEFVLAKNDEQLELLASKENAVICLDPQGRSFSSEEFSDYFLQKLEKSDSRMAIVIGGADGLSEKFKKGRELVSLSRMTFTHQATRLIIVEQIYRAFEIARGTGYHK